MPYSRPPLPNNGRCGSPSGPIGRFRSGIELRKFGEGGSNRPLVIVDAGGRPSLWWRSRRTCSIGTNISDREDEDEADDGGFMCDEMELRESCEWDKYCEEANEEVEWVASDDVTDRYSLS